jgi:hypothetical protein
MKKTNLWATLALVAAAVSGCGGGGSAPIRSYPLRAALDVVTRSGSSFTLTATGPGTTAASRAVDGDCSGTLVETDSPAIASTAFDGKPGWSTAVSATLTFSNCNLAKVTATETDFFDSSLLPVGAIVDGVNYYGVYLTPPVIPDRVQAGSTGEIGEMTFYSDSSKASKVGLAKRSYAIETDGLNSVIANSISKAYDVQTPPRLTSVSQVRYRIDTEGRVSFVSQEILQYDNSKTPPTETRVVFRCTSGCLSEGVAQLPG